MCQFFSIVTDPVNHPAEYYYFGWEYRKAHLDDDGVDSHSHICAHFALDEDRCNKYEFNPLTKAFTIDQINSERDDSEAAEKWANRLNFKEIVEPLIVKPIVSPFKLPKVEKPTDEQIGWLKDCSSVWGSVRGSVRDLVWDSIGASVWYSVGASVWDSIGALVWDSIRASVWYSVGASVWDSIGASVWYSVGYSVRDSVGALVWDSIRASVWYSVGASVWDSIGASVWYSVGYSVRDSVWYSVGNSVWAYASSFFAIDFNHDFSSAVKLWEAGLVPSFDGTMWRLHSGKNADIVYEWMPGAPNDTQTQTIVYGKESEE